MQPCAVKAAKQCSEFTVFETKEHGAAAKNSEGERANEVLHFFLIKCKPDARFVEKKELRKLLRRAQ